MCNKELSFHFQISQSSVSKYFKTWINYLYCKFKDLNLCVPKETIDENVMYQRQTNTCTVIIDCTETKIEKPQNPVSQQATYSTYKSANTLKVLLGISGCGCVTFVSDAYGGSISDRELFEKCGIINLLQKSDIILGDRGYNIQHLVSHMDVTVNMPHFLNKGSNQFEAHQLRKSKKVSSERIYVERVIGLGKTFKILSYKLSSNLVPLGGRIIFVAEIEDLNSRDTILARDINSRTSTAEEINAGTPLTEEINAETPLTEEVNAETSLLRDINSGTPTAEEVNAETSIYIYSDENIAQ